MKAFLIGLAFLIAVIILAGVGTLISPLIIVLGLFLRLVLSFLLIILAIWLLGKFIIFVWEKLKK